MLPGALVRAQIDAVLGDIGADAVKTGMLGSVEVVRAVVDALARAPSAGGRRRSRDDRQERQHAARHRRPWRRSASGSCRCADLLTPNAPEAAALTGHEVHSLATAREAALRLHALGPKAVLVKGGHLPGDEVVDLLYDGHHIHELRGARIASTHTHGTGCTLASAIAAGLARGAGLEAAVIDARAYVAGAIAHAPRPGPRPRPARPRLARPGGRRPGPVGR